MLTVAVVTFYALVQSQSDPARQARELVERLRADSIEEREQAARQLKELGKSARPALVDASKSQDAETAQRAAYLLRAIELREPLTPNLFKAMPGVDDRLLRGTDRTWIEVFSETAQVVQGRPRYPTLTNADIEALARQVLIQAKSREARMLACSAVGGRPSLRCLAPELAKFVGDELVEVRVRALTALGDLQATDQAPAIVKALKDEKAEVRAEAAHSLHRLGAAQTGSEVRTLLRDPAPTVRSAAIEALERFQTEDAFLDVVKLLRDPEGLVRMYAKRALHSVGGRSEKQQAHLSPMLRDADSTVRLCALEAIVTLESKQLARETLPLLKDGDPEVCAKAAEAAWALQCRDALPILRDLLSHSDARVRRNAVIPVSAWAESSDIPALRKLLADRDAPVRSLSVIALGRLGESDAASGIAELLGDPEPAVRLSVAEAVRMLRIEECTQKLQKLLEDPDHDVRTAAAHALCEFGKADGIDLLVDDAGRRASLSALRNPESWHRLRQKRLTYEVRGTVREAVEHLASKAGLRVQWPSPMSPEEKACFERSTRSTGRNLMLLDALKPLLHENHEPVLEDDRILILKHEQAWEFWRRWWNERKK